jgi:hypothetical protein
MGATVDLDEPAVLELSCCEGKEKIGAKHRAPNRRQRSPASGLALDDDKLKLSLLRGESEVDDELADSELVIDEESARLVKTRSWTLSIKEAMTDRSECVHERNGARTHATDPSLQPHK